MNLIKKVFISYNKKSTGETIADIHLFIIVTCALTFLEYDFFRFSTQPNIISPDKIPFVLIANLIFLLLIGFISALFEEFKKSKNIVD